MITIPFYTTELERILSKSGIRIHNIDGEWHSNNDSAAAHIITAYDPLDFLRKEAKERIVNQANLLMKSAEDAYPEFEKKTWPYQRLEVEAWVNAGKDESISTPVIDAIALAGNIERLALLSSVSAKVSEYDAQCSRLVGLRKKYFAMIDAETDYIKIAAIDFEV